MKTYHVILGCLLIGGAATIVLLKQIKSSENERGKPTHQEAAESSLTSNGAARREPLASPDQPGAAALDQSQFLELMRLRGEVTQLRQERQMPSEITAVSPEEKGTNSVEGIIGILWDIEATDSEHYQAAERLRALGEEALQAMPEFRQLLYSDTQERRYAGARAMAFVSEANPEVFEELKGALADPDAGVRDAATHGVGLVFNYRFKNVDYTSTLPALVQNLRDSSRTVRADTAASLGQYIEGARAAGENGHPNLLLPPLLELLEDDYGWGRSHSASALGAYRSDGVAAVPKLRELLEDPDPNVRRTAQMALRQILGGK